MPFDMSEHAEKSSTSGAAAQTGDGPPRDGNKGRDGKGPRGPRNNKRDRRGGDPRRGFHRSARRTTRTRYEGTLKLKYDDKGYGFVLAPPELSATFEGDFRGKDLFAHRSDFKKDEWRKCRRGDPVSFYWKTADDGQPKAFGVKCLADPDTLEQRGEKTSVYPKHMDRVKVVRGLEKGELLEGILRVNAKKPSSAYVEVKNRPKDEKDLLIQGMHRRNRACHGDRVVVRLVDPEDDEDDQAKYGRARSAGSDGPGEGKGPDSSDTAAVVFKGAWAEG